MYLAIKRRIHILITHRNFIGCKPNRGRTLAPSSCSNISHVIDRLNPTRAHLEMRSTIVILNMPHSGTGKTITLVVYSIVLPKISEARRFKSESKSPSQRLADP